MKNSMKRSSLIALASLLCLAGCTKTAAKTSAAVQGAGEDSAVAAKGLLPAMLEEVAGGVSLENTMQILNPKDTTKVLQTSLTDVVLTNTAYSIIQHAGANRSADEVSSHGYVASKEGETTPMAYSVSLALDNTVVYTPITHKDASTKKTVASTYAESGYVNFFSAFAISDFEYSDTDYTFDLFMHDTHHKTDYANIAAQLLGSSTATLTDLSFVTDGYHITKIDADFDYKGYPVTLTSDVKAFGSAATVSPIAAYEGAKDEALATAFQKLGQGNYINTAKVYALDETGAATLDSGSVFTLNGGKQATVVNTDADSNVIFDHGSYQVDTKIQDVNHLGTDYYVDGNATEGSITDNYSLSIGQVSPLLFKYDATKKIYTFKDRSILVNKFDIPYVFTRLNKGIGDGITIDLSTEGTVDIKMAASDSKGNAYIIDNIYTRISTVPDAIFDTAKVKTDCSALTMSQLLVHSDPANYSALVSSLVNETVLNQIPTYGGIYSNLRVDSYGEIELDIYPVTTDADGITALTKEVTDLETAYEAKLVAAGYTDNGDLTYTKAVKATPKDGVETNYNLTVAITDYNDYMEYLEEGVILITPTLKEVKA
jgi:hypothetical protein